MQYLGNNRKFSASDKTVKRKLQVNEFRALPGNEEQMMIDIDNTRIDNRGYLKYNNSECRERLLEKLVTGLSGLFRFLVNRLCPLSI